MPQHIKADISIVGYSLWKLFIRKIRLELLSGLKYITFDLVRLIQIKTYYGKTLLQISILY